MSTDGQFWVSVNTTRWHLRRNRDLSLYGGLAGATPRGMLATDKLRRRLTAMVAGGPLASLVTGGLAWWAVPSALAGGGDVSTAWLFASALGRGFGLGSLLIGVVTLVPGRTSGFLTDGARLRLLAAGGPGADREAALQGIFGASIAGVRPRDWPPALLETARAVQDDSLFHVTACHLAQMRAADAGDTTGARRLLDLVLARIDKVLALGRPTIRYDAARQLVRWGEVERARDLVRSGGTAVGAPALQPLAELAILVADGAYGEACSRVPTVRQAVANMLDRGHAAWLGDELDAVSRAAHAGLDRSSTRT